MDFQPTREDLDRVERAHFKSIMRRKLPIVRSVLADRIEQKHRDFPKG